MSSQVIGVSYQLAVGSIWGQAFEVFDLERFVCGPGWGPHPERQGKVDHFHGLLLRQSFCVEFPGLRCRSHSFMSGTGAISGAPRRHLGRHCVQGFVRDQVEVQVIHLLRVTSVNDQTILRSLQPKLHDHRFDAAE